MHGGPATCGGPFDGALDAESGSPPPVPGCGRGGRFPRQNLLSMKLRRSVSGLPWSGQRQQRQRMSTPSVHDASP